MSDVSIYILDPKDYTLQSASATTENGTVAALNGQYGSLLLYVKGSTWTGTITFKASQDGTNYVAIEGRNLNTGAKATTTTGDGLFSFDVTGVRKFMADHTRSAGSVTVTATATPMPVSAAQSDTDVIAAGDVAHDAADSGNPVKVGFKAESTTPAAVADGDRSDLGGTLYGAAFVNLRTAAGGEYALVNTNQQVVTLKSTTGAEPLVSSSLGNVDAWGTSNAGLVVYAYLGGYNGTTWDRIDTVNTGQLKITPYSSTGVEGIAGTVAHGAADSGNPIKTGGVGTAAAPAAVDEGDRVQASFDLEGSQRMTLTGTLPAFAAIPAVKIDQTTPGTTNGVQVNAALPAGDNNIGNVDLASAVPAGANVIGKVGIDQTTPGTTNLVQVGGTLPAFAAIPAVKIDQTTPGTTNLVQIGSTLPAFTAIPTFAIDQTTVGTTDHVTPTGAVAHGAANTANPVLTGFVAESTTPTAVDDGDISQVAGTLYGAAFVNLRTAAGGEYALVNTNQQVVTLKASTGSEPGVTNGLSTGYSISNNRLNTYAAGMRLNGISLDSEYNNFTATPFTSAARTTTSSSADQTNCNGQGIIVTINVSLDPSTASVTFTIEAKDPVSGAYTTVLTSAAIAAVGTTRLRVGSAITASANVAAADLLGRTWRVTATHADGESITYSVSAETMTA